MLFTCWQTFGLLDNFDSQSIFRTNMSEPHGWRQRPAPGWVEPLSALWADLQITRMSWRQLATSRYVTHFRRCEGLGWAPLFTMTSGMFCSFLASFLTLFLPTSWRTCRFTVCLHHGTVPTWEGRTELLVGCVNIVSWRSSSSCAWVTWTILDVKMFSSGHQKQFGTLAFIFTALLLLVGVTASPRSQPWLVLCGLLRCFSLYWCRVVLRYRAIKQFKVSQSNIITHHLLIPTTPDWYNSGGIVPL